MLRQCKCSVTVTGFHAGEKYSEVVITQGRCADHAVGKVTEHVQKTYKTLTDPKVRFKEWFTFDSDLPVAVP